MNAPKLPEPSLGVPPADDAETGLPGFSTWRSVYCFVVAVFATMVALLAALPHLAG